MENIDTIFDEHIQGYIDNLSESELVEIYENDREFLRSSVKQILEEDNVKCDDIEWLVDVTEQYVHEQVDDMIDWRLSDLRERIESEIGYVGYIPNKDVGILLVRMGANILDNE